MEYLYWTFECKTPGCDTQTVFATGSVYDPKTTPLLIPSCIGPMILVCPVCKKSNEYTESEIQPEISPIDPSPDFPRVGSK
jgi:hypothetical protein